MMVQTYIRQTQYRSLVSKSWMLILITLFLAIVPQTAHAQEETSKSGVSPQVISLPSGPGSLEGLGESFEPDLSTGTASYPYPLVVPPGVNGFAPKLALVYNGGNPNGPWGLGWALNLPYIQRQTDKGLPSYTMDDRFIFHGSEELVPVGDNVYRFENETSFMRFRWLPDSQSWEAHTPDGTHFEFGSNDESRVLIPYNDNDETFRWSLKRQVDVNGNEIRYFYERLGAEVDGRRHLYLSEVRYNFATDRRYHSVKFHYETRPDVFADRSSRAAITIDHRAAHIEVFALGKLVRRYDLSYNAEASTKMHSLLAQITLVGDDGTSTLPRTTFGYTKFDPLAYAVVNMTDSPHVDLISSDTALMDMTYDGLPDLVYTPTDFEQFLYVNQGNGRWQPESQNALGVTRLGSPDVKVADMDGDGQVDLLRQVSDTEVAYYETKPGQLWQVSDLVSYDAWISPYFNVTDPLVNLLDINNDKRIDILELDDSFYKIWFAPEDNIWSAAPDQIIDRVAVGLPRDVENIQFADMTGDRLQDLVILREGYFSYYPHNGAGSYDAERIPANAPTWLNAVELGELLLGDINNDGLADLVQPRSGQVRYWLNLGNDSFTNEFTVPAAGDITTLMPERIRGETSVQLADMNGDGAADLVYGQPGGFIQYIDFNTGTQPNLLTSIDNGLGRTYVIDYAPSTDFYVAAADGGDPWQTSLPFPVQVVSHMTIQDANSGDTYTIDYDYRDGYYDGDQKEFRGFAHVIETQHGDETAASTVTRYVYDTGVDEESRKGLLLEETILGIDGTCEAPVAECYRRNVHQPTTLTLAEHNGQAVHYSYISQSDAFLYENQDARIQLRQTVTQDQYGNPIEEFNYGQVCIDESEHEDVSCGDDERLRYTDYAINEEQWLLRFPSRMRQTDENGAFVSERINYYDGEDYVGLAQGQITKGHLKRQSDNLGPLDNYRFVDSLRQAFDEYGNVVGMMDANARPDASGGTVEVQGTQGHLTTISYDSLIHTFPVAEYIHLDDGQQLSVAASYHLGYGKITAVTDFNGNVSRYTYDAFGRMENIALPGDTLELPTQQFVYDLGSPRSSIMTISRERSGEEAVRRSVVYYDGLGRTLQTRREAENGQFAVEEATTFNARQSENHKFLPYYDSTFDFASPDPSLAHTTTHYDPLDRAIRIDNPDNSFTSIVFKPLQQVQYDEEDNRSDSPHVDTPKTLTYDGLERLVGVQEVNRIDGVTERYDTSYGYDLLDNLTRFTDAQGNVKTMRYDGLSRKLHMDDPDRGEMHYLYDDFGNVTSTTDAKGQTIEYVYDGANRLVREQWLQPNGSYTTYAEFHYDNDPSPRHPEAVNTLGQITYIIDEAGEAAFSYDARGNVSGQSRYFAAEDLDFITLMSYDATDRLATMTYPDGHTIDYTYNAHGLLESIPGFVDNIDYIASGQHDSMTYANGVVRDYGYDSRLRMKSLRSIAGSTILQDLSYTFDDNSNIIAIGDGRATKTDQNDQTQQYQYDALYRLTNATGTYGQIDYAYDSLGNMTRKTITAFDTRLNIGDMRYGENGAGPRALTTAGTTSQQYDANGNLSNKDDTGFTWDYRDQLRSVDDGELVSTYIYDSNGQRTHQTVTKGDVVTKTLYASEYTELRDDTLVQYVFAEGERVAQFKKSLAEVELNVSFDASTTNASVPDNRYWYVKDHLGGTNFSISLDPATAVEFIYFPYGVVRYEDKQKISNYKFTDKEHDESKLIYFGARYLDPTSGRFLITDPKFVEEIKDNAEYPQKLNIYSYALNNPLKFIDPDGLDAIAIVFPDYKIQTPVGKVEGLGHAGVLLVNNKTGLTKYYEYGRYDAAGKGLVRNVKVSNVAIGKDGMPTTESLKRVFGELSAKAGHGTRISGAYLQSDSFDKMNSYAADRLKQNTDPNRDSYNLCTNNCGTFMKDVISSGGVDTPWMIDPRPNSYIEELRENFPSVDYSKGKLRIEDSNH